MKTLFIASVLLFFSLNSYSFKYKTSGDCGGYPKIEVSTAPGFCLGLVYESSQATKDSPKPQKMRWAAEAGNGKVIVSDIVSFGGQDGFIYVLDSKPGSPMKLKTLFSHDIFAKLPQSDVRHKLLYQPNQLLRGRDGKMYVGTTTAIFRFDPSSPDPTNSIEAVIENIPYGGLHSLKSFTFDNDDNILLNVGSDSNVCQNYTRFGEQNSNNNPHNFLQAQFDYCPEVEDLQNGRGQIRKYFRLSNGDYSKEFVVYAKGLRNSIALVWDPFNNFLIQGENSRDAITKFAPQLSNSDTPEDEINFISENGHYGWPYCYSNGLNSPEWFNIDCSKYKNADILLPAHSAPLGFIVYKGNLFPPSYRGSLIGSLHGYESKGHRIITFKKSSLGKPEGQPLSLVYNWEPHEDQGKGKPVGLTELGDGSVLIVEDDPQNTILRLFYDKSKGDGTAVSEINNPSTVDNELSLDQEEIRKARLNQKTFGGNVPLFTQFQMKVIDTSCYMCHQTAGAPGVRLLRYDDEGNEKRIRASNKSKVILDVLKGNQGTPAMPPTGWDSLDQKEEAIRLLEEWIKSL